MYSLATHVDGTVSVILLFPIAIQQGDRRAAIIGQRRIAPRNGQPGRCLLYGQEVSVLVGDDTFDIGLLTPQSVGGATLIFPDVEQDVLAKWAPASRETVVSTRPCSRSDFPQNRIFRAAWRDGGVGIVHDMAHVRDIHLARLRTERDAQLLETDKTWMRAIGQGDESAALLVEEKRQALRDMPQAVEVALKAARTPEEVVMITLESVLG